VQLAAARRVERLVLVTPYDSLLGIAAGQFPFVPVRWLLRDTYDSGRAAPRIDAPTLLIAAEHDEVIPRASTDLLLTRFRRGIATMAVIAGTGHNTISASPLYTELLAGASHAH